MTRTDLYPRHAAQPLAEALAYSPAVLVHGLRQCGKTTLARSVGRPLGHSYVSFDDDVARTAPVRWVRHAPSTFRRGARSGGGALPNKNRIITFRFQGPSPRAKPDNSHRIIGT